jgi:alkyldihydroxyacetonephosphate synthase
VTSVDVVTDPEVVASSSLDAYWKTIVMAEAGRPYLADAVAFPRTAGQVADLVRFAAAASVPVTTRGLGSGTQGGATPDRGGLLLDLREMKDVLALDDVSGIVRVQPGIRGVELEEWLNARGWFLPHYPASLHLASVGGFVGAKGSGVLSTKYGKIEDLVASMEVVLPSGELIRTCPVPRHAVGPDINQIFVGSEGTLGVITELDLVVRRLPEARLFRVVTLPSVKHGLETVREFLQAGWLPALLRLYDEDATHDHLAKPLGTDVFGVNLVVGVDGPQRRAELEMSEIVTTLVDAGGVDLGPELGDSWWANRYKYYYPPFNPKLPQMWGTADVVCTFATAMDAYDALGDVLLGQFADEGLRLTRHFSHWYPWGTMVYGRWFIDNPPEDVDAAADLYDRVWRRSSEEALRIGAVINDHHGVGLKLAADLPAQLGSSWPVLTAVKKALDPGGIMNPGKLGL